MVSRISCCDNQVSSSRACVEHKENRPYYLFCSIEHTNQTAILNPKTGSIKTLENTTLVSDSPHILQVKESWAMHGNETKKTQSPNILVQVLQRN